VKILNSMSKNDDQEIDSEIPGKTRRQLEKELDQLRQQVASDLKMLGLPAPKGPALIEFIIFGLAILCIIMLLAGGCNVQSK